jgi:hypothetical protein
VKIAYLFCRYYPLAVSPFHIWGLIGDHDVRVCEVSYHALYACMMPTVRLLYFACDILLNLFTDAVGSM